MFELFHQDIRATLSQYTSLHVAECLRLDYYYCNCYTVIYKYAQFSIILLLSGKSVIAYHEFYRVITNNKVLRFHYNFTNETKHRVYIQKYKPIYSWIKYFEVKYIHRLLYNDDVNLNMLSTNISDKYIDCKLYYKCDRKGGVSHIYYCNGDDIHHCEFSNHMTDIRYTIYSTSAQYYKFDYRSDYRHIWLYDMNYCSFLYDKINDKILCHMRSYN